MPVSMQRRPGIDCQRETQVRSRRFVLMKWPENVSATARPTCLRFRARCKSRPRRSSFNPSQRRRWARVALLRVKRPKSAVISATLLALASPWQSSMLLAGRPSAKNVKNVMLELPTRTATMDRACDGGWEQPMDTPQTGAIDDPGCWAPCRHSLTLNSTLETRRAASLLLTAATDCLTAKSRPPAL